MIYIYEGKGFRLQATLPLCTVEVMVTRRAFRTTIIVIAASEFDIRAVRVIVLPAGGALAAAG